MWPSYFYSSLILAYFKTLYILETETLIQKVKPALSVFLKYSKTLWSLGFPLKTYIINEIQTMSFNHCDA